MLRPGRDEVLDPHAPCRFDPLPGGEAPDPLRLLALGGGEVGAELAGFGLHFVLLDIHTQCLYTCEIGLSTSIVFTWKEMPEKRIKTAQMNLRLAPWLKAAAEKAAAADNRTLTSLIEKLLLDHIAENAAAPAPRKPKAGK
jgi:hypothetical protein